MSAFFGLIQSAIVYGTIIMFGALGETLTEKGGHLNLGVPGLVVMGGFAGFAAGFVYEKSTDSPSMFLLLLFSFLEALVFSALGGLIYCFLTVTLKANQNVTGLALTSFGVGVGLFGGAYLSKLYGVAGSAKAAVTGTLYTANLNSVLGWGIPGDLLLSYGFLTYLAVVLAVVMHLFLNKTRYGLNLKAIGENPATADAAGINVDKYKYLSTCIGAAICGLSGLCYVFQYGSGNWSTNNNMQALGWLAVALVIFSTWKPLNVIWGSYLFALLYWLYNYIGTIFEIKLTQIWTDILQMIPYVVTIIVLVVASVREKRESQPPSSLGLSYFREER